jgi:hypothetical protein
MNAEETAMTLQERFATLTSEQKAQFKAAKTAEQFEAFIAESKLELSETEKRQALEYINTGAWPLADEELENVAGGCGSTMPPPPQRCETCNNTSFRHERDQYTLINYYVCTSCRRKYPIPR